MEVGREMRFANEKWGGNLDWLVEHGGEMEYDVCF